MTSSGYLTTAGTAGMIDVDAVGVTNFGTEGPPLSLSGTGRPDGKGDVYDDELVAPRGSVFYCTDPGNRVDLSDDRINYGNATWSNGNFGASLWIRTQIQNRESDDTWRCFEGICVFPLLSAPDGTANWQTSSVAMWGWRMPQALRVQGTMNVKANGNSVSNGNCARTDRGPNADILLCPNNGTSSTPQIIMQGSNGNGLPKSGVRWRQTSLMGWNPFGDYGVPVGNNWIVEPFNVPLCTNDWPAFGDVQRAIADVEQRIAEAKENHPDLLLELRYELANLHNDHEAMQEISEQQAAALKAKE